MIEFKDITLEDRTWIQPILEEYDSMSCLYSFGSNFIWKNSYSVQVANINGFYVAVSTENNQKSFLFPVGKGEIKLVIDELIEYCKINNIDFLMHGASEENVKILEELYPDKFEFNANRDLFDYIYTVESLTNLSGKKLHGKRNHIKRFKENNWSFEPITKDNIEDCMKMNAEWCKIHECSKHYDLKNECCAVKRSFEYFNELDFFGGLLRIDSDVVAYTIGERLNSNTVVVHIEKAFPEIQGAYPTINREFVANMCQKYEYVNREEDLGVEGLRKAKLSYKPAILLTKYNIKLKA